MHAIAPKAVQNFQASGDVYVPWPLDACFQRVPSALDAQGVRASPCTTTLPQLCKNGRLAALVRQVPDTRRATE